MRPIDYVVVGLCIVSGVFAGHQIWLDVRDRFKDSGLLPRIRKVVRR